MPEQKFSKSGCPRAVWYGLVQIPHGSPNPKVLSAWETPAPGECLEHTGGCSAVSAPASPLQQAIFIHVYMSSRGRLERRRKGNSPSFLPSFPFSQEGALSELAPFSRVLNRSSLDRNAIGLWAVLTYYKACLFFHSMHLKKFHVLSQKCFSLFHCSGRRESSSEEKCSKNRRAAK